MTEKKMLDILAAHGFNATNMENLGNGKYKVFCYSIPVDGFDIVQVIDGKFHVNGTACGLLAWLGY